MMDRLHKAIERFGPVNAFLPHGGIEHTAVLRIGERVVKLPKSLSRPADLWAIAKESQRNGVFAPTEFDEENGWLVQPFVEGRHATREERNEVAKKLRAAGIKWIQDLARSNVIIAADGRPVIVDFQINRYVKERSEERRPRRKLGLPRRR